MLSVNLRVVLDRLKSFPIVRDEGSIYSPGVKPDDVLSRRFSLVGYLFTESPRQRNIQLPKVVIFFVNLLVSGLAWGVYFSC